MERPAALLVTDHARATVFDELVHVSPMDKKPPGGGMDGCSSNPKGYIVSYVDTIVW